jgi:thioesterase domain-containing protein
MMERTPAPVMPPPHTDLPSSNKICGGGETLKVLDPIVPLQPLGEATPIFLVPGSGGGVRRFENLAAEFASDRPVFGIESLALSRETRRTFTIESAARELLDAVRAAQPNGPYLLGGYSLGGLIALEIARLLAADGEMVGPLLMLDCYGPPEFSSTFGKVCAVAGYFAALSLNQKKNFLAERYQLLRASLSRQFGAQPPEAAAMDALMKQEDAAAWRYVSDTAPYDGDVLLIFASQRLASAPKHAFGGWRGVFRGRVETRVMPGTHYHLLEKKNAPAVAQAIRSILPRDANSD